MDVKHAQNISLGTKKLEERFISSFISNRTHGID